MGDGWKDEINIFKIKNEKIKTYKIDLVLNFRD